MKLDTKALRYLANDDWRVLTAVETGSRNHEVVPSPLIITLSGSKVGVSGVQKSISTLAKANLISKVRNAKCETKLSQSLLPVFSPTNANFPSPRNPANTVFSFPCKDDGYRLTYGGLDYLSLHAHQKQLTVYSVGNQIGTGKESDIVVVASPSGQQLVLKIHRLGRISFRTVKSNRDYLRKRQSASWMHMSRLAAMKEFTFMKALWEVGMPVPEPVGQNRHTIVMGLVDAFPLRQIDVVPDPPGLYAELMELVLKLAGLGLIHGDFNEFNVLIKEVEEEVMGEELAAAAAGSITANSQQPRQQQQQQQPKPDASPLIKLVPILIDFPQMLSIDHPNAEFYFDRDVSCIKRFFQRRFHFLSDESGPHFADAKARLQRRGNGGKRLDVEVEASGFSRKMARELEAYMKVVGVDGDQGGGDDGREEEEEESRVEGRGSDSGEDGVEVDDGGGDVDYESTTDVV